MYENGGKSFFSVPWDKKMISSYIEWRIGKHPSVCTFFLQN